MASIEEDISSDDIRAAQTKWIQYSMQDSNHLCLGQLTTFEWRDYCPDIFRRIQELEDIASVDYMVSICCNKIIRQIHAPGKTGRLIFVPNDPRIMIKTVRKSEVKVILQTLSKYYSHIKNNRLTILGKLFGLHYVKPIGGLKVYFVVMSNITPSEVEIHKFYDLKGSTQGRASCKERVEEITIDKDQDFDFCFYLDPLIQKKLIAQIKCDCEFLESLGIMDYSLMLGVHIEGSVSNRSSFSLETDTVSSGNSFAKETVMSSDRSPFATETVSNESFQGDNTESSFADICHPLNSRRSQLGMKLPARAVQTPKSKAEHVLSNKVTSLECQNVVLYFGVVDFFQYYGVVKRIEHACKSLQYDANSIPAVNPKAYSSRFQTYLSKIFQVEDSGLEACNCEEALCIENMPPSL